MQVAKFVPEVALLQGLLVGQGKVAAVGQGGQHGQMRRAGFVQPGQQAIHRTADAEGATAEVLRRHPDGSWKFVIDNPDGQGLISHG